MLGLIASLALLTILVAFLQRHAGYYGDNSALPASPIPERSNVPQLESSEQPATDEPIAAPEFSTPLPKDSELPVDAQAGFVGLLNIIVPVAGVSPSQLLDTFADARSEGRVHDAIDIPAPQGTSVLAADDGEILKLFQSERGGITIYQSSTDRKIVFYYAHLERYANGLVEGKAVRQGEVIGHVGDTGNAGAGNYHLHFSITIVADPKRYWEGLNVNPYPLLRK